MQPLAQRVGDLSWLVIEVSFHDSGAVPSRVDGQWPAEMPDNAAAIAHQGPFGELAGQRAADGRLAVSVRDAERPPR